MSEVVVDYEAIDDLAGRLESAAAGLGTWGGSMPALPGAGAGSAQAAAMAGHLLEQLAHLTLALESAAEALGETHAAYASADDRVRSRGTGLMAAM